MGEAISIAVNPNNMKGRMVLCEQLTEFSYLFTEEREEGS
jgi:hypothetical protein